MLNLFKKKKISVPQNHRYLIYIKNTKTAGTSFQQYFRDSIGIVNLSDMRNNKIDDSKLIIIIHDQVEFFQKEFPHIWSDSYKISIVRNPYDRFVSGWHYHPYSKDKSLRELLENLPTPEIKPMHIEWKKKLPQDKWEIYSAYNHLTATQSESLVCDGALVIDEILYFENLYENAHRLFNKIDLVSKKPLPELNKVKNKKKKYIDYFNNEDLHLFNKLFYDDFTNFNYEMITHI